MVSCRGQGRTFPMRKKSATRSHTSLTLEVFECRTSHCSAEPTSSVCVHSFKTRKLQKAKNLQKESTRESNNLQKAGKKETLYKLTVYYNLIFGILHVLVQAFPAWFCPFGSKFLASVVHIFWGSKHVCYLTSLR